MCLPVCRPALLGWGKKQFRKRFIEFIFFKASFCWVLFCFKDIWAKSGRSSPLLYSNNDSNISVRG
jgi:hypothetical protein